MNVSRLGTCLQLNLQNKKKTHEYTLWGMEVTQVEKHGSSPKSYNGLHNEQCIFQSKTSFLFILVKRKERKIF